VWVLNGEKRFIGNAGLAELYVVFARTGEPGSKGISAFVVPGDADGLSVERLQTMGMPGWRLGAPTFEDVEVPEENLLGEVASAAAWLVRNQQPDGRFLYGYHRDSDEASPLFNDTLTPASSTRSIGQGGSRPATRECGTSRRTSSGTATGARSRIPKPRWAPTRWWSQGSCTGG
jgi:hypothetical protein